MVTSGQTKHIQITEQIQQHNSSCVNKSTTTLQAEMSPLLCAHVKLIPTKILKSIIYVY